MDTPSFRNESSQSEESQQMGVSARDSADRGQYCDDPRVRLWTDPTVRGRLRLRGMGISPGLAVGPAFIYRDLFQRDIERPSIELHEIAEETARINEAVDEVLGDLEETAHRIEAEIDAEHAAIFSAQAEMLRSGSVLRELRNELETELLNAEQVVKRVLRRLERRFEQAVHPTLKDRSDDIADLANQLLAALAGIHVHALETLPEGSVVVARRLMPSDTVVLSRRRTAAVVLEHAGPTSHAALLARALRIPAVGQTPGIIEMVRPGEILVVDGFEGKVLVDPDEDVRKSLAIPGQRYAPAILAPQQAPTQPSITKDGTRIHVMANVGCAEDVLLAASYGADGIGLFRTEFLYLTRRSAPTTEELYGELVEILVPMKGKQITLRLLDAGGDKFLPFLRLPAGPNPAFGRRGVRVLRDYPDLLMAHLRAILRLSGDHDIRILIPMVTLPSDIAWVRDRLEEVALELGGSRIPPLGAMIETPAAALCADLMTPHADFFSLGTNDLTQYVMAAGREDPFVAEYFKEDHLAVRRLVDTAIRLLPDKPLEFCGEAASRPETLEGFLRMGIKSISVAPSLISLVKDVVRGLAL
jgi:phosphoenolpyruvate-protein phosphotransferase (PTS system enzyme I)